MTRAWDKEISESPTGHDLPSTWRTLHPLSYENSLRTRSFNLVYIWRQASCILLGSALWNSSWVVISEWRWWILNSVKWPCSPWVLVAQWIEHPPCVREVMGSIVIGDSDISLSHARLIYLSHFITELNNHHLHSHIITDFVSFPHMIYYISSKGWFFSSFFSSIWRSTRSNY